MNTVQHFTALSFHFPWFENQHQEFSLTETLLRTIAEMNSDHRREPCSSHLELWSFCGGSICSGILRLGNKFPLFQCKETKLCFTGVLWCFFKSILKPQHHDSPWKTIWQSSSFHLKKKYTPKSWFCSLAAFHLNKAGYSNLCWPLFCVSVFQPYRKTSACFL